MMLALSGSSRHPENPKVTQAWMLLKRGRREQAKDILAGEGYTDPEHEIVLIEDFIAAEGRQPKRRKPN